jgi:hypothetical protein
MTQSNMGSSERRVELEGDAKMRRGMRDITASKTPTSTQIPVQVTLKKIYI